MDIALKYFLTVADEMNISRAAKRLYISQQCLSRHIQKLEERYRVTLFIRRPRLTLTPAGEEMLATVRRIHALEERLENDLELQTGNVHGKIRIAAAQSRLKMLLSPVLPDYHRMHPNVQIEVLGNNVRDSQIKLRNGLVDMYIGVNAPLDSGCERIALCQEGMYIVARRSVFRKYIPNYASKAVLPTAGIHPSDIAKIPYIMAQHNSNLPGMQLLEYLELHGVKCDFQLTTNDTELMLNLAATMDAAAYCTEMFLNTLSTIQQDPNDPLLAFPLQGYSHFNTLYLVYYQDVWRPQYVRDFVDLIVAHCADKNTNTHLPK